MGRDREKEEAKVSKRIHSYLRVFVKMGREIVREEDTFT